MAPSPLFPRLILLVVTVVLSLLIGSSAEIKYAEQGDMDYGYRLHIYASSLKTDCLLSFPLNYKLDPTSAKIYSKAIRSNPDSTHNGDATIVGISGNDILFKSDASGGPTDGNLTTWVILSINYAAFMEEPDPEAELKEITLICKAFDNDQEEQEQEHEEIELTYIGSRYDGMKPQKGSYNMSIDYSKVSGEANSRHLNGFSVENLTSELKNEYTIGFELMHVSIENGYMKPKFIFDEETAKCYLEEDGSVLPFRRESGNGYLDLSLTKDKTIPVGSRFSIRCDGVVMQAELPDMWDQEYMIGALYLWAYDFVYINYWPNNSATLTPTLFGFVISAITCLGLFGVAM